MMPPALPVATYRVQVNAKLGFDQASALVPYLQQLGISHFYASPLTKARAGSLHGYDAVDYQALNPELGDAQSFHRFVESLAQAGLGLILDFVPNHMGINHADNAWWLDVLEWGPQSPYASYFDIDWKAPGTGGRVLLPILGTSYVRALEEGAIALRYDAREGSFSAWYFENRLPIAPPHYAFLVQTAVRAADADGSAPGRALLAAVAKFKSEGRPTRDSVQLLKASLSQAGASDIIESGLRRLDQTSLHCLLERQHYRLAHWRLAATDINYRRFFDISSLAGVREENPRTFADVHRLIGRLISSGHLQGLRIDHVDGLYDPADYFARLHQFVAARRHAGDAFYVVMEKILGRDEPLPQFAGVAGTTGYEGLNVISRLLVDARGLPALNQIWRDATSEGRTFAEVLLESKRHVLKHILASEFDALARLLARIAAGHYGTRDFSANELRAALELYVLHFPVYRTYVTEAGSSLADRKVIAQAIAQARAHWRNDDHGIFDFLRKALTLDLIKRWPRHHSVSRVRRFAMKMQQFTGPVMAKSLEDTAFYRFHRFIAFNEVGGDADSPALSVAEFHGLMRARNRAWPNGLNSTATHDTKRGEDARARLFCLSELAVEWSEAVAGWRRMNEHLVAGAGRQRAPSHAHEYMLYQALLGAWPTDGVDPTLSERMQGFAVKAAREGKEQTNWLYPNEPYESRLRGFVRDILDPARSALFLEAFADFARRIALMGALKSLSQLTLKCTMPGVPDFYQGNELWDLSLVDPDNRRTVDFAARKAALAALGPGADLATLTREWADGRIKLALTARLLAIRRRFAAFFAEGDYCPLEVEGQDRDEIVAFARCRGEQAIVVIVARLFGRCTRHGLHWPNNDWKARIVLGALAPDQDLLADRPLRSGFAAPFLDLNAGELLGSLPVAVLTAHLSPDT